MPDTITLQQVLKFLDSGAPFSMATVTTQGEWWQIDQAVKHNYLTKEQHAKLQQAKAKPQWRKHPRHYENSTRNIKIISSGELRKIKIRAIRRFNNKIVL